jgi:hypothetical protein
MTRPVMRCRRYSYYRSRFAPDELTIGEDYRVVVQCLERNLADHYPPFALADVGPDRALEPRMIYSVGKRASNIWLLDQERNLPATHSIE